jgi:hypothetical protein
MTTLYILWPSHLQPFCPERGKMGGILYRLKSPLVVTWTDTSISGIGTRRIRAPSWSSAVLSTGTEYRLLDVGQELVESETKTESSDRERKLNCSEGSQTMPVCPFGLLYQTVNICSHRYKGLSRKIIYLHCENLNETHKYTLYRFYIFSLFQRSCNLCSRKPSRKTVWSKITEVLEEPVALRLQCRKIWKQKIT